MMMMMTRIIILLRVDRHLQHIIFLSYIYSDLDDSLLLSYLDLFFYRDVCMYAGVNASRCTC